MASACFEVTLIFPKTSEIAIKRFGKWLNKNTKPEHREIISEYATRWVASLVKSKTNKHK